MSGKGFLIFFIIIVSLHFINQFNAKRKTRERAMVSTVTTAERDLERSMTNWCSICRKFFKEENRPDLGDSRQWQLKIVIYPESFLLKILTNKIRSFERVKVMSFK